MFTNSEFDKVNQEFKFRQNERQAKLRKIWGVLLGITIFIIGLMVLIFPNQFESGGTAWILPVYGGMALLTTLIGFLVSINYSSEKPFFEYLYEQVIQKINMNEGLFLEYTSYDKENRGYNKEGGLFTGFASITNRRHIKGKTEEQFDFDIYDSTMVTSNSKNQQVHFDGVYYVLYKQLNTSIQIRYNGSPKLKGVKFKKRPEFEHIKVYKQEEDNMSNIDHLLLRFVEKLQEYENYKKVYLSVVDGQVHLGVVYRKHPARKLKQVSLSKMNEIYQIFMDELSLINEIANIDAY